MEDRQVGRRIAYWRYRRRLTQAVLAERIGRSKSWVDKVETGRRRADKLSVLDLICEALSVDLADLIGEKTSRTFEVRRAHVHVEHIRCALERYGLASDANTPPDPAGVTRRIRHAWAAFEFADYDVLSRALPSLIEDAHSAYVVSTDDRSRHLLTEVYQVTASTLRKLGEYPLARTAAERGMVLAQGNGDMTTVAATGFRVANALLCMGRAIQAQRLAMSLAERQQAQTHDEPGRALYGHLLLQAAVATASVGDPAAVRSLVDEAASVAPFVSRTSNHHHVAFNATNVQLHHVSALLALGDSARAVEIAENINPHDRHLLRRERRAALLVDVACAHSHIGRYHDALHNLLEAEATASREVRYSPVAHATIANLRRQFRTAPPLTLAQLAERLGVRE